MKTINAFPKEEEQSNLTTKECLIIIGTILISCAALKACITEPEPKNNKALKKACVNK